MTLEVEKRFTANKGPVVNNLKKVLCFELFFFLFVLFFRSRGIPTIAT